MEQINHQHNIQTVHPSVDGTYISILCYEMKNGQYNYEMTQGLMISTVRAMKAQDDLHHATQV